MENLLIINKRAATLAGWRGFEFTLANRSLVKTRVQAAVAFNFVTRSITWRKHGRATYQRQIDL